MQKPLLHAKKMMVLDGRVDGRMDGRMDGRPAGQMDGGMDGTGRWRNRETELVCRLGFEP